MTLITNLFKSFKIGLFTFYENRSKQLNPFFNIAFTVIKICSTLFILWRLPYLMILFYAYIGNVIALFLATSREENKKKLRVMAINPYQQYKVYYVLMRREKAYRDFSIGFWFLLIGANSIGAQTPYGILLVILFICLWPSLITTEWYYTNRPKLKDANNRINLYLPLFLQIFTLNLIGPFLMIRSAKLYAKSRCEHNEI